ncbi:hypothetical protein I302_102107 [Kwoniella bestiolae CBS 10118]|uniref:Uncharacterized protein n=1 Tax=Kwoniella bestiolae CBS 10118 TaxID=1296100 RepID=A0A1B9GE80_9TREE|nr:hypothetical protein I302_00795 [Kwoniella bestiolae CBS 10118]OCF29295.1 hypothetical protein I302_00795 [Kwoniella bestiolae CBS 10118]
MSPGLLDSEFTFPTSIPFPPIIDAPSSPNSTSGSISSKHPHVWDLPNPPVYGSHDIIPVSLPTLDLNPETLDMSSNPEHNHRRSSDPTPMPPSQYGLLPPIELVPRVTRVPTTRIKPNGPRAQTPSRPQRHRPSFYILDTEEDQLIGSQRSSTLYHSDSSRKRSIEGYAISPSSHGHGQPMQFRVVNPDRSSSPSVSSTNDEAGPGDDGGSFDDTERSGSIHLDGGPSGLDQEGLELAARLQEYNMITGYDNGINHEHNPVEDPHLKPQERDTGAIARVSSLSPTGRRWSSRNGTNDQCEEENSPTQDRSILPQQSRRSWLRWRKSESTGRRAGSEDWATSYETQNDRLRQGSSSTANTHPTSKAQQKRTRTRRFPSISFQYGRKSRSGQAISRLPAGNEGLSALDSWDSGLPPVKQADCVRHAPASVSVKRKGSKGWKSKFPFLSLA